jgi:proteasome accessory factor B
VRAGAAHGLRRHAVAAGPAEQPGWDTIQVSYSDTGWWSEHLASFGADVVVLEPADLREAVIGRLKGVLA